MQWIIFSLSCPTTPHFPIELFRERINPFFEISLERLIMAGVTVTTDSADPEITNGDELPKQVIINISETPEDNELDTNGSVPAGENEADEPIEERKAKKSLSITRALVLFGFDSWKALEPGK